MTLTLALLLGSAVAIYLSCELFVNGVEWAGRSLKLSQTATGSILAAFGTALPESVVTLIAVAFGDSPADKDIGIGAALGGPLALSTVAYAAVGLTMLACGRRKGSGRSALRADTTSLRRDQIWFLGIFAAKFALGLLAFPGKRWLALPFVGAYAAYVRQELAGEAEAEVELEPLKLRPRDAKPAAIWIAVQTLGALAVVFAASRVFVSQLETVGPWLGLSPQLTALLLSPIATEMPETMNAVIWIRQGKERLALANISGAMMIQATIPAALGIGFTGWMFEAPAILAAGITVLAVVLLYLAFRRGVANGGSLSWAALLYLLFAGILLVL